MPTLEEILKSASKPKEWYKGVLRYCEDQIRDRASYFIEHGFLKIIYADHTDVNDEKLLEIYLGKELDAIVTVKYFLEQHECNWYEIKIERKAKD